MGAVPLPVRSLHLKQFSISVFCSLQKFNVLTNYGIGYYFILICHMKFFRTNLADTSEKIFYIRDQLLKMKNKL